MNSASIFLLCRSAVSLSFSFLMSVSKPESLRQSISRILVALILIQPILSNAAPLIHTTEATAQRGVAMLRSIMPKTVEARAAESAKPVAEKAIGIDEWMEENAMTAIEPAVALSAPPAPPVTTFTDIPTGSYIVDMGSVTQTVNNGLKPYGLIYDLIKNLNVPVEWAISPTKAKDGTDFTYNAKAYQGGPFIIRKEYITPAVTAALSTWAGMGVVIDGPTTSVITNVPVAHTLTAFPITAIDTAKGSLITPYYSNAGIPASAYSLKTPGALSACDDFFSLPHADPTWAAHGNLVNFATTQKGYIWAACHAVSVLESLDNPGTAGAPDMNFLSQTGLVPFGSHADGTPPYSYLALAAADPVMQFIGIIDSATQVGSEQIYLPLTGWRPTTTVAVWDPSQANVPALSPGEAAVLAYGRAFGNSNNGMVMYEGGHTHDGTSTAQVAAQRAYFNFYLLAGAEKGLKVQPTLPSTMASGVPVAVTATVTGGSFAYNYQWTSSCGGTFASPTSLSTTFTPPSVGSPTSCILRIKPTDTCGRTSFSASSVTINPPTPLVTGYKSVKLITDADSSASISVGDTLNYTLQYVNIGTANSTNFQITDLLPAGISIAATGTQTILISGSGTAATPNLAYTGGIGAAVSNLLAAGATLGVGGVITVTIPVKINAGATGSVVNQASGTGTGLSAAILTDNAGATADLPATVTAAPYSLTIPASSVAQTITATVDATTFAIAAVTLSLGGKVFEDINYGGGAGRAFLTSGGVARPNARVELYDSAGAFVSFTTTNATGDYNFTGLTAGNYTVRVASRTVSSSRIGWVGTVLGVQTYRTTVETGTPIADVNRVGGETPRLEDAANGSTTLTALTTATRTANSISPVTLGASSITGIDFGFNFDTIVNTNQVGVGSFRQFIFNSNFLDNGPIAQVGLTPGKETSIFMISDGQAHPGVRAGLTNLLSSNGVAVINLPSTLTITDEDTTVDGKTQTVNIGNTNATVLGVGGTVGTDGLSLPTVNGPEVEFTGNNLTNVGLETQSPRATFRGFAIWGFGPPENDPAQADIRVLITDDTLIEECVLGSPANSFTDPGDGLRSGSSHVYIAGDGIARNTTIKNNLIGYAGGRGITALNGNPFLTITGNEIRKNNRTDSNQGGGIELRELTSVKGIISGNLLTEHKPTAGNENGIEIVNLTNPGSYSPLTIDNNTFTLNSRGIQIAATPVGISGVTVSHNVFFNNAAGVMINSDGANSGSLSTIITKNSTYNNSGLGIDLRNSGPAGVTANDGILVPNFGNSATDYPIFTSATLEGNVLKVKGYVGSNPAGNPLFAGADIELFLAADDGNNNGNTIVGDGLSKAHGEGKTYLGPVVADANGLFEATLNVSGISPGDFITATSRVAFQTSEFNSNKLVTAPVDVVAFKSATLTTDADSSGSITAGDTLTWTLQYVNVGTNPVNSFQIHDQLPVGLTITAPGAQSVNISGIGTSATKATTYTGAAAGTVSDLLTSATLAAGGIITVAIPVIVNVGSSGVLINQASGSGTELNSPVLTDNVGATSDLPALVTSAPYNLTVPASSIPQTTTPTIDPSSVTVISLPTIAAYKSVKLTTDADSSGSITAGDTLTYSLWYKNSGAVDVTTFQINDPLPSGVTISSTGGQIVIITGTTSATKNSSFTGAGVGAISDLLAPATTFKSGDILQVDIPVTINSGFTGTLTNQAKGTGGNLPPAGVFTDNVDSTTSGLPTGVSVPTGSLTQTQNPSTDPTTLTVLSALNMLAYKSVKLITDADTSGSITAGDGLQYTIHYINIEGIVNNFQINDPLPSGMTVAATGGQTIVTAGSGTIGAKNPAYTGASSGALSDLLAAGAAIHPGGTITVTIPVTVNAGFTGTLANQATGLGDIIPLAGIKTDNAGQTSDLPTVATSAPYLLTIPTGAVTQSITPALDPTTFTVTTVSAPSMTLRKSVNPTGDQSPGTELSYSITFTNTGGSAAKQVVLTDAVPAGTDFKIGSVTTDPGSTGLTIVVEYSNDYDSVTPTTATWTYTPVSEAGGAPINFDRTIKAIRWRVTVGDLSSVTPDNSGEVGFTVRIP